MLDNFRTFQLAVQFYRKASTLKLPRHLQEQLNRASSSIALNLAEGNARKTRADRARFFNIAFASLRESQAILMLVSGNTGAIDSMADSLAAHIYRLIRSWD